MEKFAERYCRDNPGAFRTADGAYLLAFALIMLNTDAHNPQADKKLALEDFVNMCQVQVGLLPPHLFYTYACVAVPVAILVEDWMSSCWQSATWHGTTLIKSGECRERQRFFSFGNNSCNNFVSSAAAERILFSQDLAPDP